MVKYYNCNDEYDHRRETVVSSFLMNPLESQFCNEFPGQNPVWLTTYFVKIK